MEINHEMAQAYMNQHVDHAVMFEGSPGDSNQQWAHHGGAVDDQGLYESGGSGGKGRYSSPYTRRSMDDSLVATDARTNRIANAEAAMRKEIYKECTFRPNIRDLPNHYGAKKDLNVPFQVRVSKWHKERSMSLETKAKVLENEEKAACTFQPKINRNSDKAVKEIRGADFNDDASSRLYKNSEMSIHQREAMINEIKLKEELARQEECTFKPKLITKNATVHQSVQSKFNLPVPPRPEAPPMEKNCTFTPQVNKLKPTMSSAQLYVSTDVVERLTRPVGISRADSSTMGDDSVIQYFDPQSATNERPIMDMASFMGALSGQAPGTSGKGAGSGFNTPGKPASGASKNGAATEGKAKRDAKFELFLARQQANIKKRADSARLLQRATTPTFKPQLARRAKDAPASTTAATASTGVAPTAEDGGDGGAGADAVEGDDESKASERAELDFITRNQIEIARRRALEQAQQLTVSDQNCTFRPRINSRSNEVRSRSIFELSTADHQRKENNRRALQLEAEQNELVNMTFQPKISNRGKREGKSVLQLSSDSSQFVDWLKQNNLKKEQKRLEVMREREEAEARDCTFSPKTTECPAYVKRIALSMSIVKAARNSTSGLLDPEAEKPQWR